MSWQGAKFFGHQPRTENDCRKYSWLNSDTRLLREVLGDLAAVLQLRFQLFNKLSQPLSGERIRGLKGKPAGLFQLSAEFLTFGAGHFECSCQADGGDY
jgi:hypothetical protein